MKSEHDPKDGNGRAGRTKRRSSDEIRAALLLAAAEKIAETGIESLNTNELARSAGVGVGTVYNHFTDKWAVFHALVLDTLTGLRAATQNLRVRAPGDVEGEVLDYVNAVVRFAEENPTAFRAAFARDLTRRHAGHASVGFSPRGLEQRLSALQSQGLVAPGLDPVVAARAFVSMQNSVVIWWLEDPARTTRESLVGTIVRLHPALAARMSPPRGGRAADRTAGQTSGAADAMPRPKFT